MKKLTVVLTIVCLLVGSSAFAAGKHHKKHAPKDPAPATQDGGTCQ